MENVENIIKALDANVDLNKSYNSCVPCSGIDRSRCSHGINQLTIRRGLYIHSLESQAKAPIPLDVFSSKIDDVPCIC